MKEVPREPDAVRGSTTIASSPPTRAIGKVVRRGFTIFNKDGTVAYDPARAFEHEIVALGTIRTCRNKKGVEIEGIEIGSLRPGQPDLRRRGTLLGRRGLPRHRRRRRNRPDSPDRDRAGGLLAIPARNLLVVSDETDLHGMRRPAPHVMIYERAERAAPAYPTIRLGKESDGLPIGWGPSRASSPTRRRPAALRRYGQRLPARPRS